ncbi:MAG: hypothetical protein ACR2GZ_12960 [Solirubrobacteraceae bacterium]
MTVTIGAGVSTAHDPLTAPEVTLEGMREAIAPARSVGEEGQEMLEGLPDLASGVAVAGARVNISRAEG